MNIWTMSLYPNGDVVETRDCPECSIFLKSHPTLHTNINQRKKKDGGWYHTSPHGRMLHRLMNQKSEAPK